MKLTSADIARKRIKESYRPNYYRRLYSYLLQAFGATGEIVSQMRNDGGYNDFGDGLLFFDDISDGWIESGTTEVIKAASMIAMSRLFGKDPEPTFTGVDNLTAAVRADFFRSGYYGFDDLSPGFGEDSKFGFLDMDCLGEGCCLFDLVEDGGSKEPRSDGKHFPRHFWLTDRFVRSPLLSPWWAGWEYVETYTAETIVGKKRVKDAIRASKYDTQFAQPIESGEYVRILYYYDYGVHGGAPTRMIWCGSIDTDPIIEESPTGRIPVAFGVGFTAPMKRNAEGRIRSQISTQDGKRAVMDYIKETLGYHAVDILDPRMLEVGEFEQYRKGARRLKGKFDALAKGGAPMHRIPAQEIAQTAIQFLEILEREYNLQSGTAEFDRANTVAKGRSASEMLIMDSRLKMNQALSVAQTLSYQRQLVIKHEQAALTGDYHPRTLNVKGRMVRVNQKGVPESWIGNWLDEPAKITISQETMTADEDQLRRNVQIENLMRLSIGLESGEINREWWFQQLVEASGYDAEQALSKMQPNEAMMVAMQGMGAQNPMPGFGVTPAMGSSQRLAGALPPGSQLANAG